MIPPVERADARANRLRLIEAAHDVFRTRGLDAEMKEIAERAGLGIGTIYRNFPRKQDLIAAIAREVVARFRDERDAALGCDDPVQAVHDLLQGGFRVIEQYGDILLATMLHSGVPAEVKDDIAQHVFNLEGLARLLRRGVDAGLFRAELDPDIAAAHVIAALHPWLYRMLRRDHSLDQIVAHHTDMLLHGMLRAAAHDCGMGAWAGRGTAPERELS